MEKSYSRIKIRCHLILFYVIYSVNFSVKGFPVVQMNYNILSNLGTCHLITFTYLITMRTFSSIFTVEKFNVVTTQIVTIHSEPGKAACLCNCFQIQIQIQIQIQTFICLFGQKYFQESDQLDVITCKTGTGTVLQVIHRHIVLWQPEYEH